MNLKPIRSHKKVLPKLPNHHLFGQEGDEVESSSSIAQIDESTEKPSDLRPQASRSEDTPRNEIAEVKEPKEETHLVMAKPEIRIHYY